MQILAYIKFWKHAKFWINTNPRQKFIDPRQNFKNLRDPTNYLTHATNAPTYHNS